ncbi:hypothetical protein BGZ70_007732 [Mortierella alpina]|uniref:RING-type E3 ubiquitin transferase n=1 Tax=Mortierella alpina TaxID=64518 RepID=A0A9P6J543_MORAP|nr:hypothetical protein BGZ70_007732 [Mortierella alpina]
MRPITAGLVFPLYCVLVLLCGTTITRVRTIIHAHPVGLLPPHRDHVHLQSRQDLTRGPNALIPNAPDTSPPSSSSSSFSAPANTPDSTTTLNQKALIEIIAPNITLFAALDLPPPTSSSESTSPSDSGAAVSNRNSSTPLLLPTSSLAILPNQIHHVNDSLIFGAGGAEPLTGVLIEWTIGCDLGDSFPIYPPTDKPWIAFMSSSLLSDRLPPTNNSSSHTENEDEHEEDFCDVSTLISIVQAISPTVTGVIMYQDSKAEVSYAELRRQTEVAIQELHYMFNPPSASGLNYIPGSGSGSLRKRDLSGLDREQIMANLDAIRSHHQQQQLEHIRAKLATPGTSPYLIDSSVAPPPTSTAVAGPEDFPVTGDMTLSPDVAPASPSSSSPSTPSPGNTVPRSVLAGIMAMGDPQLIKVLHTNTIAKGKAVIAQLTFTNGAYGPHAPSSPAMPQSPPSPSVEPERQGADRSLGLFFWIILGSVVLIVGIWTVDQTVLDGYKIKVLKQEDIESWDDSDLGAGEDDDDDPSGQGSPGSGGAHPASQQGSEKDDPRDDHGKEEDVEFNEKDEYHSSAAAEGYVHQQRVFARVDPYNHYGSPINALAMGRKSGSFDETLYGGLESSWSRRPSEQESIYTNLGRPSLKVIAALNRDARCRSWAENGAAAYADYGGDDDSVYSDDLVKGYKSHAQEGWTDMQIDQMRSLDGSRKNDKDDGDDDGDPTAKTPTSIRDPIHADLPAFPAPVQRGSVGLISGGSLQAKPTLRHKSRFILPRKTDLVPSDELTSPTLYGDGSSSAGPSTAGFLPPPGWGGDRRRSSLSTVAVPDNGRGTAQTNWTRPSGQRLRQTSMHAQRTDFALLDPITAQGDEQAERTSSSSDDGRGVGHVDMTPSPKGAKAKRASGHAHRISFEKQPVTLFQREMGSSSASMRSQTNKDSKEMDKDSATVSSAMSDCKARFSMIGVDFPDIYSPTAGEFSRLSLDADTIMAKSRQSHQRCDSKGKEHVEELQYSDSDSMSNRDGRHRKDRTAATTDTMATSVMQRSSVSSPGGAKTPTGKQRRKRYDACSVCKEDYVVGDELRELPCEHFFHTQCVDYWIKNVKGTCPICRRDFSEAGTMSAAARADRQREANRNERSSGMVGFLSPLAILAAGASGQHFWYATEAGAYL